MEPKPTHFGWRIAKFSGVLFVVLMLGKFLLPGVGPGRVKRPPVLNNLRNITIATLSVESQSHHLPLETENESGVTLSWATQILPNFDHATLYRKIDKSSNWDSTKNEKLYQTFIQGFDYPGQKHLAPSNPKYKDYGPIHFSANVHVLGSGGVTSINEVTDGTSNTMFFGSIIENIPPWGQSGNFRDPTVGLNKDPNGFGNPHSEIPVIFVDCHSTFLSEDIDEKVLRAIATPNGGEKVESEF